MLKRFIVNWIDHAGWIGADSVLAYDATAARNVFTYTHPNCRISCCYEAI